MTAAPSPLAFPTVVSPETSGMARALAAIAPPGVLVGCRTIEAGDETLLLDEEKRSVTALIPARRDASGAARSVARDLLSHIGQPGVAILRSRAGSPVWPGGVVGSMAHDDEIAVAAVARASDIMSLGIDIEPATPLAADLWDLVAPACDLWVHPDPGMAAKIHFCVKEAVYKATFPLDGRILDFHDINVELDAGLARTSSDRNVRFSYCIGTHVAVVAWPQ
jgi:4'-phosphopantetheinyl transferase EntD